MGVTVGGGNMQYISLDQQGFYKPFEALRQARDTGIGLYKDFRKGGTVDMQTAKTQQEQNAAAKSGQDLSSSAAADAVPLGPTGAPGAASLTAAPGSAGQDGIPGTADDKVVGRAFAPPGKMGALDQTDVGKQQTPFTGSPVFRNPATGQPYDWNNAHQEAWQAISPTRAQQIYGGATPAEALQRAAKAGGGYVQGPNGAKWIPYGDVGPNHNTGVEMTPAAYHALGSTPGAGHKFLGPNAPAPTQPAAPGSVATDTAPKGEPIAPTLPPVTAPAQVSAPAKPFSPMTSGPRAAVAAPVVQDPAAAVQPPQTAQAAPQPAPAPAGAPNPQSEPPIAGAPPSNAQAQATPVPGGQPAQPPAALAPPSPAAITAASGVQTQTPDGGTRFWSQLNPQEQQALVQQHGQAAFAMAKSRGLTDQQAQAARATVTPAFTARSYDAALGAASNVRRAPQIQDPSGAPMMTLSSKAKGSDGTETEQINPAGYQATHPNIMLDYAKFALEQQKYASTQSKDAQAAEAQWVKTNPGVMGFIGTETRPGAYTVQNEVNAVVGDRISKLGANVTPQDFAKLSPQAAAALVFRYEKTNDPGAIVRPEMFHTIAQRAGLADRYKQQVEAAVKSGQPIPQTVLADLFKTIRQQTEAAKGLYLKEVAGMDANQRKRFGDWAGIQNMTSVPAEIKSQFAGGGTPAAGAPAAPAKPAQSFATEAAAQAAIRTGRLKTGDKFKIGERTATVN